MFHHARRKVLTLLVAIVFAAGGCFILQAQTRISPFISHGPFIGHVTSSSALIWARCPEPGEYMLTATSGRERHQGRAISSPERDGCMVCGLRAGRRYDGCGWFVGRHDQITLAMYGRKCRY